MIPKKKIFTWAAILAALGFCSLLLVKVPALGLAEAKFCGKCHAMDYQVSTYSHSSHALEANCGDCHAPHGLVTGSLYAAYTGSRDIFRVVTNTTPDEIRATDLSKEIIQDNCLRCHGDIMGDIGDTRENGGVHCFHCHQNIVHPK